MGTGWGRKTRGTNLHVVVLVFSSGGKSSAVRQPMLCELIEGWTETAGVRSDVLSSKW